MDNTNDRMLLDLPDELLLDICRFLDVEELAAVAVTCPRLNQIARLAFRLKPKGMRRIILLMLNFYGEDYMRRIGAYEFVENELNPTTE